MRTVGLVAASWVVVGCLVAYVVARAMGHLADSHADRVERLSELAAQARLRPHGHVEAAPIRPPAHRNGSSR